MPGVDRGAGESDSSDVSDTSDISALVRFLARSLVKIALILAIPGIVTAVYVRYLHQVGELLPATTIAALSESSQRIEWLTGYYDTGFLHKVDVGRIVAPRVAVVGSSRVMQVRAQFFDKLPAGSFYNLGGCCQSIVDAQRSIRALASLGEHRPNVVLLGIDSWWFQVPIAGRTRLRALFGPLGPPLAARARAARSWLSSMADRVQVLQEAWRDPRFQDAMRAGFAPVYDSTVDALLVGVSARASRSGFRNDGSFRYGELIADSEVVATDSASATERSAAFARATLRGIAERGGSRGRYLAEDEVRVLEQIVHDAKADGIALIVFVPPIAPAARHYFDGVPDEREYDAKFQRAIAEICARNEVPLFDSSESGAGAVQATDDDFYDWLHPSERVVARLVVRMFDDSRASSIVGRFGDPRHIEADLAGTSLRWQVYNF